MASPQKENGYTPIANELLAALIRANLLGSDFMICLAVISKTYGWNKTKDQISISQFVKLTGLQKRTVIRSIHRLVSYKTLASVTGDTSTSSTYWIQKDYEKWNIPSVTQDTSVTGDTRPSVIRGKYLVSPVTHTKDNIQKTLKDMPAIQEVFEYYCERLDKPRLILTAERKDLIGKRLKEGYDVEQLKMAIDNFLADDWADRMKFWDLVYIFGTRNKINNLDKWLDKEQNAISSKLPHNGFED